MSTDQVIQALVSTAIVHSPLLATYAIGSGLALWTWSRHQATSTMIIAGCCLLFVQAITMGTVSLLLPSLLSDRGGSRADISNVFQVLDWIRSTISSFGIGFLILAALTQRRSHLSYFDSRQHARISR